MFACERRKFLLSWPGSLETFSSVSSRIFGDICSRHSCRSSLFIVALCPQRPYRLNIRDDHLDFHTAPEHCNRSSSGSWSPYIDTVLLGRTVCQAVGYIWARFWLHLSELRNCVSESRDGCPGLFVPYSPFGLCGRKGSIDST